METTIERVIFLQSLELFADIPSEQLVHLAGITHSYTTEAGDTLFEEGDSSQSLFLLIDGKVELWRDGSLRKKITDSTAIGVWGFFDGDERLSSAICSQDSHFLVIDRIDFYDLLEERVHMSRGLLIYFVKHIRKLTKHNDVIV